MVKISASLLSADFSCLAKEIQALDGSVDSLHFDIVDGHFAPNITMGVPVVRSLRRCTDLPFDVHLMVTRPEVVIPAFIDAGANSLTIHAKIQGDLRTQLLMIRQGGVRAGVALSPDDTIDEIEAVIDCVDLVVIMTVSPGFPGGVFLPAEVEKVRQLKAFIGQRRIEIAVDGGVKKDNASLLKKAGSDILIAGSAIFSAQSYAEAVRLLREA